MTKNYFNKLFKQNIEKYNVVSIQNKLQNKFSPSLNAIILTIIIPLLIAYGIFEIEKYDLIRTKKMESFEHIVNSFNLLAEKKFSKNSLAPLTYVFDMKLATQDIPKNPSHIDLSILNLKLEQIRINLIKNIKQQEVEVNVILNSIYHHENLLKIYYGVSIEDRILPIGKMIALTNNNIKMKKELDQMLINFFAEIKPFLLRKATVKDMEEAKHIEKKFKSKLNIVMSQYSKSHKTMNKLYTLFQNESQKFTNIIYSTFIAELNTPLFKFMTHFNGRKFLKIVDSSSKKEIRYQIIEDTNGNFSMIER